MISLRNRVQLLVALAALLLATAPLSAQPFFTFSSDPLVIEYDPATGEGSGVLSIGNQETLLPGAPPSTVDAWSMAVTLDGSALEAVSIEQGAYIESLNDGDGPDFYSPAFFVDGFTIGCVYSITGGTICSYEVRKEIARVTVTTVPATWLGDVTGGTVTPLGASPPSSPIPTPNEVAVAGLFHVVSSTYAPIELEPVVPVEFLRADANLDGLINIADAITILNSLFGPGTAIPCEDAGDTNDDGVRDIADGIYLIQYSFAGGPPPAAPFPSCGLDATADALGCLDAGC